MARASLCEEWDLQLLGGFRLRHSGAEVTLPRAEQRLVAFLALASKPTPRELLASELWLDADREHASGNLRTALWKIGNRLPGLIDRTRDVVRLGQGIRPDVRQATTLIDRIMRANASPAPESFSLLAEDLLVGWYENWVIIEREHHRQLRLHALEELSRRCLAEGRRFEALEAAQLAVASEPLRESGQRALVEVHLADGNRSEALRQYEVYRDLLQREMGLAPTPAMNELIRPCLPTVACVATSRSETRLVTPG